MATLEGEFINGMDLEDSLKDMVGEEEEEEEHDPCEDSEEKEQKILLGEILLTYHNHTVCMCEYESEWVDVSLAECIISLSE